MLAIIHPCRPALGALCLQSSASALFHATTTLPQLLDSPQHRQDLTKSCNAAGTYTLVSKATIRLRAALGPSSSVPFVAIGTHASRFIGYQEYLGVSRGTPNGVLLLTSFRPETSYTGLGLVPGTGAPPLTSPNSLGRSNNRNHIIGQILESRSPSTAHLAVSRQAPSFLPQHLSPTTAAPLVPNPGAGSAAAVRNSATSALNHSADLSSPQPHVSVRKFSSTAAAAAASAAAAGEDGSSSDGASSAASAARDPSRIRNFAIIAHIDHGKTTLMDRLLAACGHASAEDRAMDSHSLERERGITILAKVTSFTWGGFHMNAVDTPGHADFGGEVERVLGLVDGCVLLVDAAEGPLAQTKYVVSKALERGLRPIVLLNKVDRPAATPERCAAVANSLLDLFVSLGASDDQLDFPLLYASAKQGWASRSLAPTSLMGAVLAANAHQDVSASAALQGGMGPLLDTIVSHVPAPGSPRDLEGPFVMRVAMIERDPYIGRIATGRIASGKVRIGDKVRVLSYEAGGPVGGEVRITRISKRAGMSKIQLEEAVAGDIVSVAGPGAASIADTIASPEVSQPLDPGRIDPPTLAMVFGPNDSPLAGRAGKALTGRAIGERLMAEAETSVSLKVAPLPGGTERYEVQARGELQLGVLIEGMRREGAELAVSPPQVLLRHEGREILEPLEEVMVEVADEVAGSVIEALSQRRGELTDMTPLPDTGKQRLTFIAPSRGLIGFKSVFVHMTRGEGIMSRVFLKYTPYRGPLGGVRKGVLVSLGEGRATSYAIGELQSRGTFFIGPGTDVYCGMVVGEHNRDDDLDVNPVKEKKTSNVRNVTAEEKVQLAAPRVMTLEDAIGYVAADELIEVTPAAVRIRKEILDAGTRRVRAKREQKQ